MKRPQFVINFEYIDGLPYIKVQIGHESGYLLLDTTSKHCFLSARFFEEHGNPEMVLPCEESEIGKTISILTFQDYDFKVPMIIKPLEGILGILGTNFLHRWKMVIDFDAEMLYSYNIEEKER